MGRIQSSIGLISGVNIADTVDQLLKLSARPRDLLISRAGNLQKRQVAITELTALLVGVQLSAENLGKSELFTKKSVTSSDESLITARVTGTPPAGSYSYTPVQVAQAHQLLSSGFSSLDATLAPGKLTIQQGGFVDRGVNLEQLNGGTGIERGKIRITDRAGSSTIVDLRYAQTIEDVVAAINAAEGVSITATTAGDRIQLTDTSGQTVANLQVQEVGGGATAASLGLAGISVAASTATGQDVLRLHDNLSLDLLNDGNGVRLHAGLPELEVTFRDNIATLQVELDGAETIGDVLEKINSLDPTRLQARISSDGDRLELLDLTTDGGGTFSVSTPFGGSAADDLGLTSAASGGTLTGQRILGGLRGALLTSLKGGAGLANLGLLSLTDRSGASASVDLSSAATLEDVVNAINSAGIGVQATINQARNGLQLTDTSGGTGNLIVANGDATNAAEKLQIETNAAVSSTNSGSLHLQVFNENQTLASLNNGRGVQAGSFLVTNSAGVTKGVNLRVLDAKTVGDVVDAINGLNIGVQARINTTGDGLLLVDNAGGSGQLTVADVGTGTAAADLRIAGQSQEVVLNGTPAKVIDGAMTTVIDIEAEDTLQDLVDKINGLDAGVSASIFNVGSGPTPFRLSITSQTSGKAGELLVDSSEAGFSTSEIAKAQDSLLLVGSADSIGAGILVASQDNQFNQVLDGVNLQVKGTSTSPVTIDVRKTDDSLLLNVQMFVDQFNKLTERLNALTFFNEDNSSTGLLFGTNEALRIESDLTRLVTDRFRVDGSIQSLEVIGLSITDEGKLKFDKERLKTQLAADPAAVQKLFTEETSGMSARFRQAVEQLAGEENSVLMNKIESNQRQLDIYNERIERFNEKLEREKELLLKRFYDMETALGRLQNQMSALTALQPLINGQQ